MSTNIFEIAARKKFRFPAGRISALAVEDLFDISLRELDEVAKIINRQINAEKEESFLSSNKSVGRKDLDTKLEVVKAIIFAREEEATQAKEKAEKKQKRQSLIDALAAAEQRDQLSKTPDQLRAELAALEEE